MSFMFNCYENIKFIFVQPTRNCVMFGKLHVSIQKLQTEVNRKRAKPYLNSVEL